MAHVIIMRGLPGSGKTTWVRDNAPGDAIIVSADTYFMQNGRYQFDPSKIAEAHNDCLRRFVAALQERTSPTIVVDNTNLRVTEIAPYYRLAEAFGYTPIVVWVHQHPDACANRNIHNVPRDAILKMMTATEALPNWMNVEHV